MNITMISLKKSRIIPALLLAGLLLTAGGSMTRAAAPAAPPATRIAVVNLVDLFEKLLEKASADTDLANMKSRAEAEIATRSTEIDKLKQALSTFKENSKEFKDTQQQALEKSMSLDVYAKVSDAMNKREQVIRTMDLYKKICDAVAEYSKANGIGLVFVTDSADIDKLPPDQFSNLVQTRKILYADQSFDITKALIQKMNTDFQLRTPAKPAAKP